MSNWTKHNDRIEITLDSTTLELLLDDSDHLLGVGKISQNGIQLRNDAVPFTTYISSLKGVDYTRYRFEKIVEDGNTIRICTRAIGERRLEQPYGDQYNDHLLFLSEETGAIEDTLEWILQPESVTIGENTYSGFSYAFRFSSETESIHRILVRASWEIDGKATGNTILSQGQVTPAVYTAEPATHFTSACLQSLERFGDPCAMSFQFCPRYGVHQCFDFFTHEKGTLLGFWNKRNDTRSFIQKNENEESFFVLDALHWTATKEVETPRKLIVFSPAGADGMPEHEARNRWKGAYDYCNGIVRDLFGIKKSNPLPERTIPYGTRIAEAGKLQMRAGETWVPSQEWLIAVADTMLEPLAKSGMRRVITEPIVETDPTQRGFECKLDKGIHGDLNVGSVCCVHRYRPAEMFGGMKAWRYFADKAHSLGMEVGHWVGPHLAHHAPILQEHPDWAMKSFTTLDVSGGYPNFVLSSLNWNTPVREWILDDLKRMHDEAGLDYIWFDSFANLGLLPLDFSKEMQPNACAILEFMAKVQEAGISNIAVEGMSPVAMSGAFIMDHEPGHDGGVQSIAGQNSWHWYEGNEDMLCDQQSRAWTYKTRTEDNVRERLFRCLANHFVPEMKDYISPFTGARDWYTEYVETYMAVETNLKDRRILPDREGVVWSGGESTVLFAYKDISFPLPANTSAVYTIQNGEATSIETGSVLEAKAYTVYRID